MKKIPEAMTEEECHASEWPVWVLTVNGNTQRSFVNSISAKMYADSLEAQGFDVSLRLEQKLGATFEKLDPDADDEGIMRTWEKDDFVTAFAFGWVVE